MENKLDLSVISPNIGYVIIVKFPIVDGVFIQDVDTTNEIMKKLKDAFPHNSILFNWYDMDYEVLGRNQCIDLLEDILSILKGECGE